MLIKDKPMALEDQVAIITGGGRGIGRATAIAFAREGAAVAVCARTKSEVRAVAEDITAFGATARGYEVDVTDESGVQETVRRIENELGLVDILVNNAAELHLASIADTDLEAWERLIAINLRGPFLFSRAVLPSMIERQSGRIINVGSLAGRRGYEAQGAYCASKHGLVGLSKVLAIEAQPHNVRVNMVSPGGVITGLSRDLRESRGAVEPSEWMIPEEVADAILFVATQDGAAVTDELVLRRYTSEPWR